MAKGIIKGVSGETFDLTIDTKNGIVKIGDQVFCEGIQEARIFLSAYKMGRNHKKLEIKNALDI
jgi:hypothetical protein